MTGILENGVLDGAKFGQRGAAGDEDAGGAARRE
jgi:hypothetical protein